MSGNPPARWTRRFGPGSRLSPRIYGSPLFEYLDGHAADAAVFNAAMSSSPGYVDSIVAVYDFSNFKRVVDVGGGHGLLLAGILSANPRLQGVLQDLPSVVTGASALRREPLSERCEIIGGSFFEDVPARGDAYILKGIIHDWDDGSRRAGLAAW